MRRSKSRLSKAVMQLQQPLGSETQSTDAKNQPLTCTKVKVAETSADCQRCESCDRTDRARSWWPTRRTFNPDGVQAVRAGCLTGMDDWETQVCVEGGYCRPVAERDRMSARYRREERMLNRLARNNPWSTPCEGERNRISRCRVKSERICKTKS